MDKTFKILTGPRGGQYYIDETGKKHYVKKSAIKKSPSKYKVQKPAKFTEPKLKRYVCYYAQYENDEMVDDFKEWCDAYSVNEARSEFEARYSHNPNIKIQDIVNE